MLSPIFRIPHSLIPSPALGAPEVSRTDPAESSVDIQPEGDAARGYQPLRKSSTTALNDFVATKQTYSRPEDNG
jgi:hypothetical protein